MPDAHCATARSWSAQTTWMACSPSISPRTVASELGADLLHPEPGHGARLTEVGRAFLREAEPCFVWIEKDRGWSHRPLRTMRFHPYARNANGYRSASRAPVEARMRCCAGFPRRGRL